MMDITDSRAVLSFNPQRILILVNAVATRSMRHHRAHHLTSMEMESSDDLCSGSYRAMNEPKD
jgi:hypothetical protein